MRVLAHGVDLVEIQRIEAMLDEHGDRFLQRCFSEAERAYADSGRGRRAERYAVRIACKEAVFKALGTGWSGGIRWLDVEVDREPTGRPRLALTGRCAELATELGIVHWHVSLSHTTSNALASVVGCG
ncbi:MAG: holo-ACP synthase [Planctomycetes bacterium]|nr:holo-ACP synthase [Planctomycetota bacterium]